MPGLTLDEVIEGVWPSADPSTRDCLAALTKPGVLPGCVLDDFWIEAVPGSKSRPEHNRKVQGRLPVAPERPLRPLSVRSEVSPALRCD